MIALCQIKQTRGDYKPHQAEPRVITCLFDPVSRQDGDPEVVGMLIIDFENLTSTLGGIGSCDERMQSMMGDPEVSAHYITCTWHG